MQTLTAYLLIAIAGAVVGGYLVVHIIHGARTMHPPPPVYGGYLPAESTNYRNDNSWLAMLLLFIILGLFLFVVLSDSWQEKPPSNPPPNSPQVSMATLEIPVTQEESITEPIESTTYEHPTAYRLVWCVQLCALSSAKGAESEAFRQSRRLGVEVSWLESTDGYFKVYIKGFPDREEAKRYIQENALKGAFPKHISEF